MGFSTEHSGRGPKVVVPGTGQFLNSTILSSHLLMFSEISDL